jgi:hypothetical protein
MPNINEIINSILNHEESNKILKTLLDTHKYDSEVKTHLKKINLKKINNNDDYSHSKYSKYTKYIKFIDVEKRDVWEREGCYYVFDIKIEIKNKILTFVYLIGTGRYYSQHGFTSDINCDDVIYKIGSYNDGCGDLYTRFGGAYHLINDIIEGNKLKKNYEKYNKNINKNNKSEDTLDESEDTLDESEDTLDDKLQDFQEYFELKLWKLIKNLYIH